MIRLNSASIARAIHTISSFALAVTLITGLRGSPSPVYADPEVDFPTGPLPVFVDATAPAEVAARIQVIIKSVDVANDRDGFWTGGGDIELTTSVWRCTGPNPPCSASDTNKAEILAEDKKSFNADSGEFVALNRVIPSADDVISPQFASEFGGFAMYDNVTYLLQINAFEEDVSGGDFMGGVQRIINKGNDWAVGTYTREPAAGFSDTSLPGRGLLCAGCGGIIVGDYLVTYEIRLMPLPDMHPKSMSVKTPGGPQPQVCANIENLGSEAAEAYGMIFTVDGDPTSRIAGRLNPNQTSELCVQVDAIAVGTHTLGITVDPDRAIAESNEKNNVYSQQYTRRVIDDIVVPTTGGVLEKDPGTSGQPPILTKDDDDPKPTSQSTGQTTGQTTTSGQTSSGSTTARANLQVTSIRVDGKEPRANDDCKAGKHDIAVVVKNQGTANATNFAVKLEIQGKDDDDEEKNGVSVNAGQEATVTFDDVQLKEGVEALVATADSKKSVEESDENNNELKVSIRCKKDDD